MNILQLLSETKKDKEMYKILWKKEKNKQVQNYY